MKQFDIFRFYQEISLLNKVILLFDIGHVSLRFNLDFTLDGEPWVFSHYKFDGTYITKRPFHGRLPTACPDSQGSPHKTFNVHSIYLVVLY